MAQRLITSIDRAARIVQNVLGSQFTHYAQKYLGRNGTRFIREILGRSPRHRVQLSCNKQIMGSGDGSWIICPDLLMRESIVYSIGVGTDITFDLELIKTFGVRVFAFDPTPVSVAWVKSQQIPKEFQLIDCGISNFDGFAKFYRLGNQLTTSHTVSSDEFVEFQVFRIRTVMQRLGHEKIDLLKMDIEGEEYAVIEDIISSGVDVGQLEVEFHHRFPGVGAPKTKSAVTMLNGHGYRIFHISDSGREYSFLKI